MIFLIQPLLNQQIPGLKLNLLSYFYLTAKLHSTISEMVWYIFLSSSSVVQYGGIM